mmetsp:Transcript_7837/g.23571  ORF Transcript_7837/g.23571 Transcript_7837/m.23571 type:complete len:122 (+) Transcript_7837:371-736(+)
MELTFHLTRNLEKWRQEWRQAHGHGDVGEWDISGDAARRGLNRRGRMESDSSLPSSLTIANKSDLHFTKGSIETSGDEVEAGYDQLVASAIRVGNAAEGLLLRVEAWIDRLLLAKERPGRQ